jgi:hypothetical protein
MVGREDSVQVAEKIYRPGTGPGTEYVVISRFRLLDDLVMREETSCSFEHHVGNAVGSIGIIGIAVLVANRRDELELLFGVLCHE